MMPDIAVLKSENNEYEYNKKICGLYPIERNIIILSKTGVKKIFLDLPEEEKSFYKSKVSKHLNKLKDVKIIAGPKTGSPGHYLLIPSNLFTQPGHFNEFKKYFKQEGTTFVPVIRENQFLIKDDKSLKTAVNILKKNIIGNTGGFIAQKINKRLSMPVSLLLVNTRIHPNYLTILNMIIGIFSSIFLLFNSYTFTVLGGFLFQIASVMDGVDGEVAKFTFKVSKIGGWLDTLSDNLTLLLFLTVLSYLYYKGTGGILSMAAIVIIFAGITAMIITMLRYLRRYSKSGSLVAYDREFLQRLPQNDFFVMIPLKLKYFLKKEFFSVLFFAVCLTGKAYLIIPLIAFTLFIAGAILIVLDLKYLKTFGGEFS